MKPPQYLVDRQWLVQHLNNPQVKIIDCRFKLADPDWGEQEYLNSHIPGAYYLDLDRDLSSEVKLHGGRHPLPNSDVLAQKFAEIGIVKNETLVVAYDDSRFAFAARLWWLLKYLGHDRVVLLDGGWNGWLNDDFPINNFIPKSKLGDFAPQIRRDWAIDIETLKSIKDRENVILIDSRDEDRYLGLREPIDPIAGSIPGALNSPWKQITDESGNSKSLPAQQQLWDRYQSAEQIIVYCGSGVTACVNLFSLARVGLDRAKLYAGGWSDWCSYLNSK